MTNNTDKPITVEKSIGWHFHEYSKWSDKYRSPRSGYSYQSKTCLKCGRIKERAV